MFFGGDYLGGFFGVEFCGLAVSKDADIADFAGQSLGIEFDAGLADCADYSTPVRVAAVDSTFE